MADENVEVNPQETVPEPHGGGAEPAAMQEQEPEPHGDGGVDWKGESRKWEDRAKSNLSALRAKEAEADRLKAQIARAEAVAKAAKENGVDADLLGLMAGDTPDRIAENAATLKAKIAAMPIYPNAHDNGAGASLMVSKDQIDSIKDPVERVRQRAAHLELYK